MTGEMILIVEGVQTGNLDLASEWTVSADKVLVF
jgi:hypothetical protein